MFVTNCFKSNIFQTRWFQNKQSPAFGIKYNSLHYTDENIRNFIVLVHLKKIKMFERVNPKSFLQTTRRVHEIVVMMYSKSLKVEMAGLILGILCEILLGSDLLTILFT